MTLSNNISSGIYVIENLINKKYYIGSSKDLGRRKIQHLSDLRNNRHGNIYLQNSFNKYGEENFKFDILEYCEVDRRVPREQKWLDMFNDENCYNMCALAASPSLGKGGHSKETIEGMRERMSDPEYNPMSKKEYRDKISEKHSLFSNEKSEELCKEFLNKAEILNLAKRENCARRCIETAIAKNINKYISGPLTKEEHKWKLREKRRVYNIQEYIQMYNEYMDGDMYVNSIGKHFNITPSYFRTMLSWFEKGNELLNLKPDPDFHKRKQAKDKRLEGSFRKYPDSFYFKLLDEYNSGKDSIQGLANQYGCHKSWIKTARRLNKRKNELQLN